MDKSVTNHTKKLIAVILSLLCLLVISFTLSKTYRQKDIGEMSFKQAKSKNQFHLDVRDGAGQFKIKPFRFSEVGRNSFKTYFKNEGRNEVVISFFRLKENGETDNEVTDTVLAGESKEWIFDNPTSNDSDKYMLTISDASEPLPVVIGEFFVF